MFGYVRPCKPELRVREYEAFRAMYCGLCHTLGRRYGSFWRFLLNYDFCYLALVLSAAERCDCRVCPRRCAVSPLRPRATVAENPALDFAADATVILSYWKLRDSAADERGLRRLGFRLLSLLARRGYRRAEKRRPDFALAAEEGLRRLSRQEAAREASLDRPADSFAGILRAGAAFSDRPAVRRALEELLYHTGRWIYIVDAWDDCAADQSAGLYNPIAARYALSGAPDASVRGAVEETLERSAARAAAAAELLDLGPNGDLIKNVLYLGMPAVAAAVLRGTLDRRRTKNGSI